MKSPKIEIEKVDEGRFIIRCNDPECVNSDSGWTDRSTKEEAEEVKLWHESWHRKRKQN